MPRGSRAALLGVAVIATIESHRVESARMLLDQVDKLAEETEQGCDEEALASCHQMMQCDSADGCEVPASGVADWTTSRTARVENFYKALGVPASPTCTQLCKAAVNAVPNILGVTKPTKTNKVCVGKDCSNVIDVAHQNVDVEKVDEEQGEADLEHPLEDATDLPECKCTKWRVGAMFTETTLCVMSMDVAKGTNICTPVEEDGSCGSNSQKCTVANTEKEPNLPHDDENDGTLLRRLLSNVFNLMPAVDVIVESDLGKGSALAETGANASAATPVLGGHITSHGNEKALMDDAIARANAWLAHAAQTVGQGQANEALQTWLGQSDPAFAQKQVKLINSVVNVLDSARIKNGATDPERICFNHVGPMAYCKGSPSGCTQGRGCANKDVDGRYEIWFCPKAFDFDYLVNNQFISHGHTTHGEALAAILIHEGYHHASVPQIMDQNHCGGMGKAKQCAITRPQDAQNAGYNYQHMVSQAARAISNFVGEQKPPVQVHQPVGVVHQNPGVIYHQPGVVHQNPGVIYQQAPTAVHRPTGGCSVRQCCLTGDGKQWSPALGHVNVNQHYCTATLRGQWYP